MKEFEWVKLSERRPEACHVVDGKIPIRYVAFDRWQMDFASLSLLCVLPKETEIQWMDTFPSVRGRVGGGLRLPAACGGFVASENMPSKTFVFHVDIKDPVPASAEAVNAVKQQIMPYEQVHLASGLKVGDWVKVVRKAADGEMGWGKTWASGMDRSVGCAFKIMLDAGKDGFQLSHVGFLFPSFVLQKIETRPAGFRDHNKLVLWNGREWWLESIFSVTGNSDRDKIRCVLSSKDAMRSLRFSWFKDVLAPESIVLDPSVPTPEMVGVKPGTVVYGGPSIPAPDATPGWRILERQERVVRGDQLYDEKSRTWADSANFESGVQHSGSWYRRRLENQEGCDAQNAAKADGVK